MTKKRNWGRWETEEQAFNEGGQGRLYLVHDTKEEFKGEFVLKELKNPKRSARFASELQAIDSLEYHPHLIRLVDKGIFRDEDKPCYVMERADETLESYLSHNKNINNILNIYSKICKGIAYLHSQKIIHRDIKPENILMFSNEPVIADLGLCLICGESRNTVDSEAVGPRFYMAPELEDGKCLEVDFRADVYSLGKVLYYMLSDGKIFTREKHKDPEYYLPKIKNDQRLKLFYPLFDKSISQIATRYLDAKVLLDEFEKVNQEYLNHPITVIHSRFGNYDNAIFAPKHELTLLGADEIDILFDDANTRKITIPEDFLKRACSVLDARIAKRFTVEMMRRKNELEPELMVEASKRILSCPDGLFSIACSIDEFTFLALNALAIPNQEILRAVINFDILQLSKYDKVLSRLAVLYHMMSEKEQEDFVVYSIQSNYEGKEQFLLDLSYNNNLSKISFEAVIAGLSNCLTKKTKERIHELGNRQMDNDIAGSILRGILLGGKEHAISEFKRYDWSKNPNLESFIQVVSEIHDEQAIKESMSYEITDFYKDDCISNGFCDIHENFNEVKRNAEELLNDIGKISNIIKLIIDENNPEELISLASNLNNFTNGNHIQIVNKIGNQDEYEEALKIFKIKKEFLISNGYWNFYQDVYYKIKEKKIENLIVFYDKYPKEKKSVWLKLLVLINHEAKQLLDIVFDEFERDIKISKDKHAIESRETEASYCTNSSEIIIEFALNNYGFIKKTITSKDKANESVTLYTDKFEEKFLEMIGFKSDK